MKELAKIIAACKKGDKKAQSRLYELYAPSLFALCLRYSKNKSDAEDILHDAFIKVFTKIKAYEEGGSFQAWMSRIFVNDALKFLRSKNKGIFFSDDSLLDNLKDEQESEDPATVKELILNAGFSKEVLLDVLLQLPEGYRVVFNLFYFEKYGHKAIAEMLNISVGTSKSQLFKSKKMLQSKLYKLSCTSECYDKDELHHAVGEAHK